MRISDWSSDVCSSDLVDAAAATGTGALLFELLALGGEADIGEAQEDQAEDGAGVFLGLEPGIGAELVGGVPEVFFQGGRGGVLLGRGDPVQGGSRCVFGGDRKSTRLNSSH